MFFSHFADRKCLFYGNISTLLSLIIGVLSVEINRINLAQVKCHLQRSPWIRSTRRSDQIKVPMPTFNNPGFHQRWDIDKLRVFFIVPHEKFPAGGYVSKGTVVNVSAVLKHRHVLFFLIASALNKPHPTRHAFLAAVNKMAELSIFVNLSRRVKISTQWVHVQDILGIDNSMGYHRKPTRKQFHF